MSYLRMRLPVMIALSGACAAALLPMAHAQTALVPVPNASVYAGEPASTYNGATSAASVCAAALNAYGDGCPATQAQLGYPIGLSRDATGNVYTADFYDGEYRVIYQGTGTDALAAALIAANPQETFKPTAGNIYGLGRQKTAITAVGGIFYCNGVSGAVAMDTYGSGCPAYYAVLGPRDITVDASGSIFVTSTEINTTVANYPRVYVIYVAGTAAANLIKAYNPTVTTPLPGYIYALSAKNDFGYSATTQGIGSIVLDSNENVFVSDNLGTINTVTGLGATTYGGQIKQFSTNAPLIGAPGWVTYVPGTTTTAVNATAGGEDSAYGDGGTPANALVDQPTTMFMDSNNNLYISDQADRRYRVIYNTGATPPLYVGGTNLIVTPTSGYIYSVVGGGPSIAYSEFAQSNEFNSFNGVTPTFTVGSTANLSKTPAQYIEGLGVDTSGNMFIAVSNYASAEPTNAYWLMKVAAGTGELTVIGGQATNGTTGTGYGYSTSNLTPLAGYPCRPDGGTPVGPTMTDAYGDGCPATELSPISTGPSRIMIDSAGDLYQLDSIGSSSLAGIVREYIYPTSFGSVNVGSSLTLAIPFTFGKSDPATNPTIALSNPAFFDAGTNDECFISNTTSQSVTSETCVYYVTFQPSGIVPQMASLTLSESGTSIGSITISGTGASLLPVAATPTFSITAGTYTSTQSVTISDTTTGATIYYTTDGTTPTATSTKYVGAISVSASETLNAIAIDTGAYLNSAVATAAYVINLPNNAATPTFTPAGGAYTSVQSVTIADTTPGASIYYTTNGSTPTTASTAYTGAITVGSTETIMAIATATGFSTSGVGSAVYTITLPPAAMPTFSPAPGTSPVPVVTISDTTQGAAIYYTTNGNTPTASSTLYTGPITLTATTTIEAIAIASGYSSSPILIGTYTVGAVPTFTLSVANPLIIITPGLTGTVPVMVTQVSQFNSAITFACSGLPTGAACSFSTLPAFASGTAMETVTVSVPAMAAVPKPKPGRYGVELAAMLCLLCGGWRMRRRPKLLALLLCLSGIASLSGCGGKAGFSIESQLSSAQSYTITVTGTSGTLSNSTTFTLTVP